MSETGVIEAAGLTKRYGDLAAVDGIDLRVERGECFGILGPNGAGKTTTIRMAYGFTPLTAGELRVFGLDVRRDLPAIKARLGVCQQGNTLDPDLTIAENLLVYSRYYGIPREAARRRADELLKFIALEARREAHVAALSGGLVRRLMLARALINDPELLILDEPTTGLDPQSRHALWDRLSELRRRGLTILLTTHYLEEAARLCTRLVIMDRGRILVEGAPRELVREHAGASVVEVTDPSPGLREFAAERGLRVDDLGHRLIVYAADGEELYREITKRFCDGECLLRPATLEDVFLRLTGRDLRE
ncbi:MAG TPA: ATP-binding cassette domain-containing protein [bacterium]